MISDELLRKVRKIEISTKKIVDDLMTGQFRTQFKGHGVQFSEHRIYSPGDDVRHIDWKVSARSRDPLVKKYEEEREVTVFLVVDVSPSEVFGSHLKLKSEIVAEVGAILAYASLSSGDKVGALLFSDSIVKMIPMRKGKSHVLRVIRDLLDSHSKKNPTGRTHLAGALEAVDRLMKHKGIVFLLSDFIADDFEIPLKRLARKHDVVAISVSDRVEENFPSTGIFLMEDPETGQEYYVDTRSHGFKEWIRKRHVDQEAKLDRLFKSSKVERLKISTEEDYGEAVVRFFRNRARRTR